MSDTKPKEMIFDFLQTVFTLLLIAFCVYYFIVEGKFFTSSEALKSLFTIALFGFMFLFKLKKEKIEAQRQKDKAAWDEIALVFTRSEYAQNVFWGLASVFSLLCLAWLDGAVDKLSVLYFLCVSGILAGWHFWLFRRRYDCSLQRYATNIQVVYDRLVVYFMPVLMSVMAWGGGGIDILRILQIFSVFIILYIRHHIVFKRSKPV